MRLSLAVRVYVIGASVGKTVLIRITPHEYGIIIAALLEKQRQERAKCNKSINIMNIKKHDENIAELSALRMNLAQQLYGERKHEA